MIGEDTALGLCGLFAAGVFGAVVLSIWSTRRSADRAPDFRQRIAADVVWAAIPCLMVVAGAIAILTARE